MLDLRRLQADPQAFRETLRIDVDGSAKRLGDVQDDWQQDDFIALDQGWRAVIGQKTESNPILRSWLKRPRGHSKTNDIAVMATWALFASRRKLAGFAAAADKDQARLLRDAIDQIIRLNAWLGKILDVQQHKVINKRTGSVLEIISSDAPTSYGLTPDFVIVDELTHWGKRDLWDSLLSATAKRKNCLLLIIANAGFQQSWQWDTRETIRQDSNWYFSRLNGPKASWITADRLQEQKKLLPSIAYNRLWLNQWSSGSGDALSGEMIDAAITLSGPLTERENGWLYVAGVDLGLTRDASAVVVVGKHIGRVETRTKRPKLTHVQQAMVDLDLWDDPLEDEIIDRIEEPTGRIKLAIVRLWKPEQGKRVSIDGIEKTLIRLHDRFILTCIGFDPWQAALLKERVEKAGINTEEVPFTANNLTSLCSAVLGTFNENLIELYDHPQLLQDLRNLRIVEKSYGVRLDSPRGLNGHGDAATALSIALKISSKIDIALHSSPSYVIAD